MDDTRWFGKFDFLDGSMEGCVVLSLIVAMLRNGAHVHNFTESLQVTSGTMMSVLQGFPSHNI